MDFPILVDDGNQYNLNNSSYQLTPDEGQPPQYTSRNKRTKSIYHSKKNFDKFNTSFQLNTSNYDQEQIWKSYDIKNSKVIKSLDKKNPAFSFLSGYMETRPATSSNSFFSFSKPGTAAQKNQNISMMSTYSKFKEKRNKSLNSQNNRNNQNNILNQTFNNNDCLKTRTSQSKQILNTTQYGETKQSWISKENKNIIANSKNTKQRLFNQNSIIIEDFDRKNQEDNNKNKSLKNSIMQLHKLNDSIKLDKSCNGFEANNYEKGQMRKQSKNTSFNFDQQNIVTSTKRLNNQDYFWLNQTDNINQDILKILKDQSDALERNDITKASAQIVHMLSKAIDLNDMKLFTSLIFFLADLAFEMNEIDCSAFFYNQCRILTTYTQNYPRKIDALYKLGICAKIKQNYQEGIQIMKKALEYAWYINDKDKELAIYEEIGKFYYYLVDLKKASYYNERFLQGLVENEESPIRKTSIMNIQKFNEQLVFTFTNINSLLLTYLGIPLLNLEQMPQLCEYQENYIDGLTPRAFYNYEKNTHYLVSNIKLVLQSYLKDDEFFSDFLPSPRDPCIVYNEFPQKKNRINVSQSKPFGLKEPFQFDQTCLKKVDRQKEKNNFKNPFYYKVTLDEKIQHRLKSKLIDKFYFEKIKNKLKNDKLQQLFSINKRIFLNHLNFNSETSQQHSQKIINHQDCQQTQKTFYKAFLIDYLEKHYDSKINYNFSK